MGCHTRDRGRVSPASKGNYPTELEPAGPVPLALRPASPYIDTMTARKSTLPKRRTRTRPAMRRRVVRKRANPRRHVVKAQLANFELVKAGSSLRLQIFSNAEKIGQLEVGRGSLYWYGRNRKSRERVDWSRFAE